ncbi:helix-turn-helix domain-containing protein [Pelagibacterium sediminicola]|uniref:helix-turn-helix domain-containing protein n=1 Tax=Pelagibacterium sediminicola TaxID=2248761 RepID=UPI000E30C1DE
MSQRKAARHFGISRDTVRKTMAYSVPPSHLRQTPVRHPKLDAFIAIINGWLGGHRSQQGAEEMNAPARARNSAWPKRPTAKIEGTRPLEQ